MVGDGAGTVGASVGVGIECWRRLATPSAGQGPGDHGGRMLRTSPVRSRRPITGLRPLALLGALVAGLFAGGGVFVVWGGGK